MSNRDDFSVKDIEILAKRAAQTCSNPDCGESTSGPHTNPNKAINVGVAAHTCSASPGGKRYNKEMTQEERSGIENGIWLCQRCAKLIDSDEQKFTVEILKGWKENHERRLAERIKGSSKDIKEVAEILRVSQQNSTRQILEGIEKILPHVLGLSIQGQPALDTIIRIVPDNPPPLPAVFTPRDMLVQSINGELKKRVWVALIASTGMGKTQVSKTVLEQWPNANKYWISLRGVKEQLHYHVDEQLLCFYTALTGDNTLLNKYDAGEISGHKLSQNVAAAAGSGSLIVIDDLPDLLDVRILVERLKELGAAFQNAGGKLLTTSQYQLPQDILNTMGLGVLQLTVPPMDGGDIKVMLSAVQAPALVQQDKIGSFILGVTKGHPVLIAATVRWLSINGWMIDGPNFGALLAGEPMNEARQETSRLTRRLISDISTRELLDRLSIVNSPFNVDMALAVANTEPAITRPKEHFDELIGPWIQPIGKYQYEVSPLLQKLWEFYIESKLQKRLHITIAYDYLKRKPISANDAFQTCIHLHAAGDSKTLADFLLQFMLKIKTTQQAKYFDWVQWFYAPGKEWPTTIPLSEMILIRALQTRVLIIGGQNPERYETDLEHLISMAKDEDAMAVAVARYQTATALEQSSPGLTARRSMEAARALRRVKRELPELSSFPPEGLFWGATTILKDCDQIESIIEVIRDMTEEERIVVFHSDIGPEMSVFFADSCYALEADKEKGQQDWGKVLGIVEKLQEIGELPGAEPLYAASLRARAIVLADFLNNTDGALDTLDKNIRGLNEGSSFILIATKASILLTNKRTEEAYDYFVKALSIHEGKRYRFLTSETLKRGMMAATHSKHFKNARDWCTNAVKALRDNNTGTAEHTSEYIEMIGELAWIHWVSGYPKKSCAAMYMVVNTLTAVTNTDLPRYKETFLKTGHVLSWLASVAMMGEPPSIMVDGESYFMPYTGIFFIRSPKLIEWPATAGNYLPFQLARMASGVGNLHLACKAYLTASEFSKQQGIFVLAAMADLERASVESHLGNFDAAFAAILSGIRSVPLIQNNELETADNPVIIWGKLTIEEKASIEVFHVFHIILLPAFTRLIEHCTEGEIGIRSLEKMQSAMVAVQESLLKQDRWDRLIGYMKLAFAGDNQREIIITTLRNIKSDDNYERLVLYMALACQTGAIPEEIANAQAIALSYINELGTLDNLIRQSVSHWIVETWYNEVDNKSYQLNTPGMLRKALSDIPRSSSHVSEAARVLLAAEHAAGATYDKSVREKLIHMSNPTKSI